MPNDETTPLGHEQQVPRNRLQIIVDRDSFVRKFNPQPLELRFVNYRLTSYRDEDRLGCDVFLRGNLLTLAVTTGTPIIDINRQTATFNAGLAGTQGFQKIGGGTLTLTSTANSANLSGKVNLTAGYVYEKYSFDMAAAYIPRGLNPFAAM